MSTISNTLLQGSMQISLVNKIGLIVGVSNNRSIGWSILEATLNSGASIIVTYKNPVWLSALQDLKDKYDSLRASIDDSNNASETECHSILPGRILAIHQCNVDDDSAVSDLCQTVLYIISKHSNISGENTCNTSLDFVVYTPAYANKATLKGDYFSMSRADFLHSLSVSCYGLNSIINKLHLHLSKNASILALSYYGSQKVVPNYDLMGISKAALESNMRYMAYYLGLKGTGIRANILSPGPVRTISSYAIAQFEKILQHSSQHSPLHSNVTLEQISNAALYLLSDFSIPITGSVHYIDNGQNIMHS